MPADKSLFYYGPLYRRLFDPPLAEARHLAVELIPAHSSVLDLACGTGQFCFALRTAKSCRVTGLDLSVRMLELPGGRTSGTTSPSWGGHRPPGLCRRGLRLRYGVVPPA